MMGDFRLGYVMVKGFPAGLELPTGARNKRKATMKILTNPNHDPNKVYCFCE